MIAIQYKIYMEQRRNGCIKKLLSGHTVRVDTFSGYPLWKVKVLLKCKNWRIRDSCKSEQRNTYYIDIL